jgi:hypothetical protein
MVLLLDPYICVLTVRNHLYSTQQPTPGPSVVFNPTQKFSFRCKQIQGVYFYVTDIHYRELRITKRHSVSSKQSSKKLFLTVVTIISPSVLRKQQTCAVSRKMDGEKLRVIQPVLKGNHVRLTELTTISIRGVHS